MFQKRQKNITRNNHSKKSRLEYKIDCDENENSVLEYRYAGGAKDLSDLDRVLRLGQGRVALTIGSALDIFGGKTKYSDVVKWCKRIDSERCARKED